MKFIFICSIYMTFLSPCWTQTLNNTFLNGHSHNDYFQKQPFTTAFEAGMASIEADVFLWNQNLYVAHTPFDIDWTCTLDALYVQPIVFAVRSGKAYPMQLMIDVKTSAEATLNVLARELARYPDVFNDKSMIKIVISGNRPTPSVWSNYPSFIQFDGRPDEVYTPEQWQRVGLVSDNFNAYKTSWWGKDILCPKTCERLKKVLNYIHSKGKKMRFWKTPDDSRSWETLYQLGVDFINTDSPTDLKSYFEHKRNPKMLVQNM